jgi:hypothetical protein
VRPRLLTVPVSVVLACAGVSACRTNVGLAAKVGGHTITESQVQSYLTAKSEPVPSNSGGTIPPRSYVLELLIDDRVFPAFVATLPGDGNLGPADIDSCRTQALGGTSVADIGKTYVQHGYRAKLAEVIGRRQTWLCFVQRAEQTGANVQALLTKFRYDVSVNPRYGAWDAAHLALKSGADDGLPGVLAPASSGAAAPQ